MSAFEGFIWLTLQTEATLGYRRPNSTCGESRGSLVTQIRRSAACSLMDAGARRQISLHDSPKRVRGSFLEHRVVNWCELLIGIIHSPLYAIVEQPHSREAGLYIEPLHSDRRWLMYTKVGLGYHRALSTKTEVDTSSSYLRTQTARTILHGAVDCG